jgi:hypothetical protein
MMALDCLLEGMKVGLIEQTRDQISRGVISIEMSEEMAEVLIAELAETLRDQPDDIEHGSG